MYNILNITPHLGGGVGTVLLNMFVNDVANKHSVVTLDYANDNALRVCSENNINLLSQASYAEIISLIEKFDIIVFHIWNHPLLYDFLIREKLPKSRVVFWLHTAGLNLPYVFPEKLLDYPDICVVSTPLTFQSKEYKNHKNKEKFRLVWATGGLKNLDKINKTVHTTFNIGYIGTVDYFRLHKDVIKICHEVNIPNSKFIFCGGPKQDYFNNLVRNEGLSSKVSFVGEVKDIEKYLSEFDVFAYMLSPTHCGSCDQSLQEAMAAGVVPVVFDNPMENTMVEHRKTGLVARNTQEFAGYIEFLYENSSFRQKLSKNAKIYAKENYGIKTLIKKWNEIFTETMFIERTCKSWPVEKREVTSYDIFLESLGDYASDFVLKSDKELKELFKEPNWQSENKGTPKQYYRFLGGRGLERLVKLYE